ncbi:hypothetical protein VCHA53O466_40040 [Vibrio chagasii]|nr:hypothetical protein VCHA53O466_40040 [Vibrio chagasii]
MPITRLNDLVEDYLIKAEISSELYELKEFTSHLRMDANSKLDDEKDIAVLKSMYEQDWCPKKELINMINESVTPPTALDSNDEFTIKMELTIAPPAPMQKIINSYNARKSLNYLKVKQFMKHSPELRLCETTQAASLFPENNINTCIHRTFQFNLHKELTDLLKQYPDSIYIKRIKQNDLVKVQSIETQYQGMGESDVIIGLLCPIKRTTVNRSIHDVEFNDGEGNRNLYFTTN